MHRASRGGSGRGDRARGRSGCSCVEGGRCRSSALASQSSRKRMEREREDGREERGARGQGARRERGGGRAGSSTSDQSHGLLAWAQHSKDKDIGKALGGTRAKDAGSIFVGGEAREGDGGTRPASSRVYATMMGRRRVMVNTGRLALRSRRIRPPNLVECKRRTRLAVHLGLASTLGSLPLAGRTDRGPINATTHGPLPLSERAREV